MAEVVPEIWSQVEPLYRRVLENDEAVLNVDSSGETAADPGRIHHWLASYYPVHLDAEVIGVGVVVVDITERRQAEEFRSNVLNNMAEGLISVDAQGRLTSMNSAATEMLGWTEGELFGKVIAEVILPQGEDSAPIREDARELLKVRAEGRQVRLEDTEYVCKNGSRLSVAVLRLTPLEWFISRGRRGCVSRHYGGEIGAASCKARAGCPYLGGANPRGTRREQACVVLTAHCSPCRRSAREELLLRMVGRSGELYAPGAFLGVAEKYGLILEIDQWVVKQAVRLAAQGRHVSANLSAETIVTIDLLALIENEIRQAGADPSNLVFEITETTLMRDIDKGEAFARGLAALGCGVALDDFGTGFGTFTHVKRLPIKYLKIDIEFVRDLVASSANQHVVKAIVNLAQGFGCQTIAEGVENAETLQLLQLLGVDFGQGFHLGRPAPL